MRRLLRSSLGLAAVAAMAITLVSAGAASADPPVRVKQGGGGQGGRTHNPGTRTRYVVPAKSHAQQRAEEEQARIEKERREAYEREMERRRNYKVPEVERGVGGFVIDGATKKPLSEAKVIACQGTGKDRKQVAQGSPDDEFGGYAIALEKGTYVLECSADGWRKEKTTIRVGAKGMVQASFALKKAPAGSKLKARAKSKLEEGPKAKAERESNPQADG